MKEFPAKAGTGKRIRARALVLNVNPIMARGAALADFTMVSGFATDITQAVSDGAMVDPDPPYLRILPE